MAIKHFLSVVAMAAITLCSSAQDRETYVFDGSFTPKLYGTDASTGLNFWVKSVDPFEAVIMGSQVLTITGRTNADATVPDNAYTAFAPAAYSGAINLNVGLVLDDMGYTPVGIGYGAFANCTGVTSVQLPRYLTTVSRGAFYGCTGLTEVTQFRFPVKRPGSLHWCTFFPDVFSGCSSLIKADISIADFIWDGIFSGCHALREVTITTSGNQLNAFRGHSTGALQTIRCLGENPGQYTDTSIFSEDEYVAIDVIVPAGTLAAYKAHPVWGLFENLHE